MEEKNVMENPKAKEFLKNFFKSNGIPLKKPSRDELYYEIVTYLRENNILTLATCKDNMPRATVLEYRSDGIIIYMGSEGGGKFANLAVNQNVSFTISSSYTTFFSCRGLQGWGKAEVFKEGTKEFEEGMKILKPERALAELGLKEMPSVFSRRLIKIISDRFAYNYILRGFINSVYDV